MPCRQRSTCGRERERQWEAVGAAVSGQQQRQPAAAAEAASGSRGSQQSRPLHCQGGQHAVSDREFLPRRRPTHQVKVLRLITGQRRELHPDRLHTRARPCSVLALDAHIRVHRRLPDDRLLGERVHVGVLDVDLDVDAARAHLRMHAAIVRAHRRVNLLQGHVGGREPFDQRQPEHFARLEAHARAVAKEDDRPQPVVGVDRRRLHAHHFIEQAIGRRATHAERLHIERVLKRHRHLLDEERVDGALRDAAALAVCARPVDAAAGNARRLLGRVRRARARPPLRDGLKEGCGEEDRGRGLRSELGGQQRLALGRGELVGLGGVRVVRIRAVLGPIFTRQVVRSREHRPWLVPRVREPTRSFRERPAVVHVELQEDEHERQELECPVEYAHARHIHLDELFRPVCSQCCWQQLEATLPTHGSAKNESERVAMSDDEVGDLMRGYSSHASCASCATRGDGMDQ